MVHLNGRVNRHNCVYWSQDNPHVIMEHELNLPGVTVWCGVPVRGIVGPYFFFNETVNSEHYLQFLEELRAALDNDARFAGHEIILQQDGAPCHYGLIV